jgi:3,4-dihydroxy 2-butanone 4-phosphate synthase/GTP cyclohydrolase II
LAGFEPASVICEILNEDGNMARATDLTAFAEQHDLKISSVAELIRYRLKHEPTVVRIAATKMNTMAGEFDVYVYHDIVGDEIHVAMVKGTIEADSPTPVRVQVESGILDVFRELQQAGTWSVSDATHHISKEGKGVLVILRYKEQDDEIVKRVKHAEFDGQGIEFPWREIGEDLRVLGVGGQILADVGVGKMRVLGSRRKMHALSGFGLEIVDYVTP